MVSVNMQTIYRLACTSQYKKIQVLIDLFKGNTPRIVVQKSYWRFSFVENELK